MRFDNPSARGNSSNFKHRHKVSREFLLKFVLALNQRFKKKEREKKEEKMKAGSGKVESKKKKKNKNKGTNS